MQNICRDNGAVNEALNRQSSSDKVEDNDSWNEQRQQAYLGFSLHFNTNMGMSSC